MPAILRKLPFFEQPTTLRIPGGPVVPIKHHQIILWVSLTAAQTPALPPTAPRFPVVLDTGFNDNFLIQEQHLLAWAGLTPQQLPMVDVLRADGQRVPLRDADIWIHANQPGFRDQFAQVDPFCIELDTGIAVWPTGLPGARRLPLLGVRGLRRADLQLNVDCRRCRVSLGTASWWSRLFG